ncbi:UNVERIFIED_CONTAM: hypothetical protein FKN15_056420 [Acipenser sinensis]
MWILVDGLVPNPVTPLGDREPATGDPDDVDRASEAQVGNREGAAASRGASLDDRGPTSGSLEGAKQETRRPIVRGEAVTQKMGPATKSADTNAGCLGARIEGSDPSAPARDIGVVVGAVVDCGPLGSSFDSGNNDSGTRHSGSGNAGSGNSAGHSSSGQEHSSSGNTGSGPGHSNNGNADSGNAGPSRHVAGSGAGHANSGNVGSGAGHCGSSKTPQARHQPESDEVGVKVAIPQHWEGVGSHLRRLPSRRLESLQAEPFLTTPPHSESRP